MATLESLEESVNRKLKRQKQIIELRKTGLTYNEISKKLNISASRVQQIAKSRNIDNLNWAGEFYDLPVVAIHCLLSVKAKNLKDVIYLINKGILNPRSNTKPPGYGKEIHKCVLNWVDKKQGEIK